MSLMCENCGAPYRGTISQMQKFVKCQHCGCVLRANPDQAREGEKRLIIKEVVLEESKEFDIDQFASFLVKRGIKDFDVVSGVLRLGSQQVYVDRGGSVTGSEPLRGRTEKWVQTFMSQS